MITKKINQTRARAYDVFPVAFAINIASREGRCMGVCMDDSGFFFFFHLLYAIVLPVWFSSSHHQLYHQGCANALPGLHRRPPSLADAFWAAAINSERIGNRQYYSVFFPYTHYPRHAGFRKDLCVGTVLRCHRPMSCTDCKDAILPHVILVVLVRNFLVLSTV